jgi:hypothetical protein
MEPRHVARLVGSQVATFVGPVPAPARSDQHNGPIGNASVLFLPAGEIGGRDAVVGMAGTGRRHIHDHHGAHELRHGNLIDAGAPFPEMHGRIQMSAAMFIGGIIGRGIEIPGGRLAMLDQLPGEALGRGPVDSFLLEGIGQINRLCRAGEGNTEKQQT